ncbi:MAG: DoxX family protein [Candidatus Magasanikbacteria bacterium]|nr:DoxX family protein [Candidatus Magasanikbacteria bacterium]
MCKIDGKMGCHGYMKHWGLLGLRLAVGFIIAYMGYSKLWIRPEATATMMATIGIGSGVFWAYLVGILEFVGGLMIMTGVYAPIAATWQSLILLVAIFTVHRGNPVTGYFLPLAVLGGCLALMGTGAGKYRLLKMQCCCKSCRAGCMMCGTGGEGGGCGGNCGCDHDKPTGSMPQSK